MQNIYINQIWKCLPIFENHGYDSYSIYLSKTIGRMRNQKKNNQLTDVENHVLNELEALYNIGDILTHQTLRSVILSCTAMLSKRGE